MVYLILRNELGKTDCLAGVGCFSFRDFGNFGYSSPTTEVLIYVRIRFLPSNTAQFFEVSFPHTDT